MNIIFEISADDIALLGDEDLRSLVARSLRILNSETRASPRLASRGAETKTQKTVDLMFVSHCHLECPRSDTGFQVKAEDIPLSKIDSEMRPEGVLRQSIQELAKKAGAYILVSSRGSTSDIALQKRREAMAEALRDLPKPQALKLDFYDRKRLETWLRGHAGTTLWVREIGKPLQGWLPLRPVLLSSWRPSLAVAPPP